jgi:hypothetical protein
MSLGLYVKTCHHLTLEQGADDFAGYEFPQPHCRTTWNEEHWGPLGEANNGTLKDGPDTVDNGPGGHEVGGGRPAASVKTGGPDGAGGHEVGG